MDRRVLRFVLSRALAVPPEILDLQAGPWGKPMLGRAVGRSLAFNMSHSGGLTVCALRPGGSVGIDVEIARELKDADAVAKYVLDPGAIVQYERRRSLAERSAFLLAEWTRREAVLKALGVGLSQRPSDVVMQNGIATLGAAALTICVRDLRFVDPAAIAAVAITQNSDVR